MSNVDNLVPQNKRTKSEQRKIAQKGGIASGKARKRKKQLKEIVKIFLEQLPSSEKARKKLKEAGFEEDEMTNQALLVLTTFKQAMKGNMRAIEFLRDMSGENPYLELKAKEFKWKKEQVKEGKVIGNIPIVLVDDVNE